VVEELVEGPVRFGDLGTRLSIATNVLAERLRRLERAGLVVATPYQHRPPRLEYALTDEGRELAGAVAPLRDWGARRDGRRTGLRRHASCGSELELRPWCPTCEQVVERPGDDDAIWV
jgi:DNA-binding HxlR family transcriptional regulator